jgi:hypothetical protein
VNLGPDTKRHQKEIASDEDHPQQEEPEHLLAVKTCYIHCALLPSSNPVQEHSIVARQWPAEAHSVSWFDAKTSDIPGSITQLHVWQLDVRACAGNDLSHAEYGRQRDMPEVQWRTATSRIELR